MMTIYGLSLCASDPVCIVINEQDVKTLGEWPINRKWIDVSLQNLQKSSPVQNVFF